MRAMCASAQSKACLEFGPKSTATRRSLPRRRSTVSRSSSGAASGTTGTRCGSTTYRQLYSSTSSSSVSIDDAPPSGNYRRRLRAAAKPRGRRFPLTDTSVIVVAVARPAAFNSRRGSVCD
nr:unnamed protein product [Digitaria exilis]